jgi:hypothetical protein
MASPSRIHSFYRGDTRDYKLVVNHKDGTPVPLYGKILYFTLKVDPDDTDDLSVLQIRMPFPDNTDSQNGIGYLHIDSTQTNEIPPGPYYYDFQIVQPVSGKPPIVITIDSNKVEILKDVTRITT